MSEPGKVVIVSQHYPPDSSTTAAIMARISEHLAAETPVLVSGSATADSTPSSRPAVIEIRHRIPAKATVYHRRSGK